MRVHREAEERRAMARWLATSAVLVLAAALGLPTFLAAEAAPKIKSVSGLKMKQDAVEGKESESLKATGGKKKNSGGTIPRYHLEQAWPAK